MTRTATSVLTLPVGILAAARAVDEFDVAAGELLDVVLTLPEQAGRISEQQEPIVTADSVDGGRVSRAEAAVFVPQHARALRV